MIRDVGNIIRQSEHCVDKCAFTSKADAKRAERQSLLRRGVRLKVYRCPVCTRWHLTSQGMS